ncbi:MAG: hypothetical protein M0D57_13815 [Sphingobacteriales bacterium JAD_PAG50586_3]|nr:MAG: hypothetical protein M0D57_13815 [Sphingobacteriales bacterium JAD_PAG50586_3]
MNGSSTLTMTGVEFVEKPDSLTDEEWAVCVNNPESVNYDAFAFNPYLPEWGEGDRGGKIWVFDKRNDLNKNIVLILIVI